MSYNTMARCVVVWLARHRAIALWRCVAAGKTVVQHCKTKGGNLMLGQRQMQEQVRLTKLKKKEPRSAFLELFSMFALKGVVSSFQP